MKRRLLNLATLLSLLFCVATCVLWVRSYQVGDWLTWRPFYDDPRFHQLGEGVLWTGSGHVAVGKIAYADELRSWDQKRPDVTWAWGSIAGQVDPADLPTSVPSKHWAGFGISGREMATHAHEWRWLVWFPLWLPACLFAAVPALRLYRRVRRRYAAGHCPRCGYDLRATPDRCPECGDRPSVSPCG